jgi:DNA-binding protein HU-beta
MPIPKSIQKISGAFAAEVTELLKAGEEVSIPGVGKFKRLDKPARPGRNPMTGESLTIAAKKSAKFSQSSKLVEALNS